VFVEGDLMIVSTMEDVSVEDPAGASRRTLMPGTHTPRRVGVDRWPYVMLTPATTGSG